MIKHIALMAVALIAATAQAEILVNIHPANDTEATNRFLLLERQRLGSGVQGLRGYERANLVLDNDIFHAPQYLPYHPTAATIWPRVMEVKCDKPVVTSTLFCEDYKWAPSMGRAEYLFVTPKFVEPVQPIAVPFAVPGPVRVERVLIEVPVKKARE